MLYRIEERVARLFFKEYGSVDQFMAPSSSSDIKKFSWHKFIYQQTFTNSLFKHNNGSSSPHHPGVAQSGRDVDGGKALGVEGVQLAAEGAETLCYGYVACPGR